MENVNIKINGMPLSVPNGISILEAARYAGIEIPTLCFLKDINEIGACRICMVEVKGARNLVAACVFPVAEGMEIFTNTEKVRRSRKTTLELILSTHDKKCLTCVRSGNTPVNPKSERNRSPMQTMSTVKKSIITAVCIALCYVLPLLFHGIQGAGQIFCPMHIPVFLCGLVCGWQFGLLCGLAGPALSSALCGMPPVSILPSMMIELAVYGLIAGIMMRCVRTRHVYADLYISLIVAIVAGRVVNGLVNALIFARGSYSMATWVAGSVVKSWPGTVIQLVFIPSIVFALMKARLIPERYPKEVPADD